MEKLLQIEILIILTILRRALQFDFVSVPDKMKRKEGNRAKRTWYESTQPEPLGSGLPDRLKSKTDKKNIHYDFFETLAYNRMSLLAAPKLYGHLGMK